MTAALTAPLPGASLGSLTVEQCHYEQRVGRCNARLSAWAMPPTTVPRALSDPTALRVTDSGAAVALSAADDAWRATVGHVWGMCGGMPSLLCVVVNPPLSTATGRLLHIACMPHQRLTLSGTACFHRQPSSDGAVRPHSVAAGLEVGDLHVSLARDGTWWAACRSQMDELGQQWGVACSMQEVQASVRCRAWGDDVWCTPTLTLRKDDTKSHRGWLAHCCLVVDVDL